MLSRQKKRTIKYLTLSLFSYKDENCAKESTKGKTLINGQIKLMEEIHKCSYILFGWADERNTQMFIYSLFVIASGEYFFSK